MSGDATVMERAALRLFDSAAAREVTFGSVARNVTETTRDPHAAEVERYVALDHVEPDSLRLRSWGEVRDGTTFTRKFVDGQVLFAKRRAYQRKVAKPHFSGVCSGDLLVFEALRDQLAPSLLPYIVQSDAFIEHAVRTSAGSLSPRTKWSDLRKFSFLLPDGARQEQLAELFDALDATIWVKEDARDALHTTRQAFVEHEIARPELQGAVVSLDDLIDRARPICYGILKPGRHVPDGVPVVKVKDYPKGHIDQGNLHRTSPQIDAEYRRSTLAAGDLLLSIRGTVGRLAEVPQDLAGANITQDTARVGLRDDVSRAYVRALLESSPMQRQMRMRTVGLAVQGLNIRDVRALRLPFPPDAEQQRLLAGLAAFTEVEECLTAELAELVALKRRLLEALVRPAEI